MKFSLNQQDIKALKKLFDTKYYNIDFSNFVTYLNDLTKAESFEFNNHEEYRISIIEDLLDIDPNDTNKLSLFYKQFGQCFKEFDKVITSPYSKIIKTENLKKVL